MDEKKHYFRAIIQISDFESIRCLSLIRGFFNAVDIRQEGVIQLEDLVWFLDDARDLSFGSFVHDPFSRMVLKFQIFLRLFTLTCHETEVKFREML